MLRQVPARLGLIAGHVPRQGLAPAQTTSPVFSLSTRWRGWHFFLLLQLNIFVDGIVSRRSLVSARILTARDTILSSNPRCRTIPIYLEYLVGVPTTGYLDISRLGRTVRSYRGFRATYHPPDLQAAITTHLPLAWEGITISRRRLQAILAMVTALRF